MQTLQPHTDPHEDTDRLPGFNPVSLLVVSSALGALAGLSAGIGGASPLAIFLTAILGGNILTLALILLTLGHHNLSRARAQAAAANEHRALS